jgi:hypothetical protein
MPLMKRKKPDPTKVYICWQPFSQGERVVHGGARLRGSDPVVKAAFENFVEDGVPASEWPSPFDEVIANYKPRVPAPPPFPLEEAVRARESFSATVRGEFRQVARGQLVHRDDALVKRAPEHFETLPQPLSR